MVNLYNKKREKILDFLKKRGRSSTTKIASAIKSDIGFCKRYLYGLKKEGKIKMEKETQGTYWELI